ncbi:MULTISPECIES: glycosyltransferase [unclassified Microbulbifer]|uniref:glycosyltransferase n=1 Tax=unclassified Microbulbifer TaxID=2619833 RepID=UPI0027E55835|nr:MULTISPECIES: glycosyltransferase [unclassified Microbulbifer]
MPVTVLQLCHCYTMPFVDISQQYAELMQRQGARVVTVFLTRPRDEALAQSHNSDKTVFLELRSQDVRGLKLGLLLRLRRLCREEGVSLVVAHRWKPIYLATLLQLTMPSLRVSGVAHALGQLQRRGRRLLFQLFGRRVHLLGVSDATRDDLRRCLPAAAHSRVQTLYNYVDFDTLRDRQLDKAAARKALGLPDDAWVFGNVGRLHPHKDQATLLRAFARIAGELPSARLCILGQGELETHLRRLAAELGVATRVDFLGVVHNAARYFRAFDCFVLSSEREPFGMVLLEAMAAEVPVIASDAGGAREVVNSCDWRPPPGDVEAFAERMRALAALDDSGRDVVAAGQLAYARGHFSPAAIEQQLRQLELYQWLREVPQLANSQSR